MKGTGNSTMKFANDPLWQKINSFPIDNPAFSQKLAKENNWDTGFTTSAIREYKRFIYLCCTLPNGASPPPVVDEVWHLHILYTVNYWEEFCDKTLGRKLHHHPSKGGLEEKEKHIAWLQETMENYQLVFEEAPPPDIWNPQYQPIAKHSPLSRKFTPANLFIIIPGILGVGAIFWGQAFLLFPIIVTGAVVYKMFAPNQSEFGTGSDTGSGGCSSGGGDSSGCGSSCGGGCGGCGGGD